MKRVYIGIFAHPDDESFGPSGSLMQYIAAGADVHLICATLGQSGQNATQTEDLSQARLDELTYASKTLGTKSLHTLGFHDGELSNNLFHAIAAKTSEAIDIILADYSANTEVIFVTMDQTGLSGHIDHIVMSMITSYIFVRLSENDTRIKNVHYYCLCEIERPHCDTSFVFMPKGRTPSEIDIKNDITEMFERKKALMRLHKTQKADAEKTIEIMERANRQYEYFYTFK